MKKLLFAAICAGLLAGCSPAKKDEAAAYNTTLDMKEVMGHVVDPAAQAIWRSSGFVDTAKGTRNLRPTTDEGWEAAETGAVGIVEAGNLLKLPGRARDDGDWMKFATRLSEAGLLNLTAIAAKDDNAMFEAGGKLYEVCTACHEKYLIPYLDADGQVDPSKMPPIPKAK